MVSFFGRLGFVIVILLSLVGLLSVVTRCAMTIESLTDPQYVVTEPEGSPVDSEFNQRYADHPAWTLVHAVAGFFFMTLGPLQFVASVRNRWPRFHRWCGRVFLLASVVGVVSALAFVPVLPIYGSFSTRVGVIFASILFCIALAQGYRTARTRNFLRHREWMIRVFAIGLGISTFRVLIPLLMMCGASFVEAWDSVVWLGFAINAVVAETWINVTRQQRARSTSTQRAASPVGTLHSPAGLHSAG